MITDKYLNILITWVVVILFLTTLTVVKAQETSNLLSNGSFTGNTDGWELDGTASYDNATYSDGISKSVRFSGDEGGSVSQSITLGNISSENQEVTTISGRLISIGCNNEGSTWCTKTATADNLDPVTITMTLSDETNTEILTYNFTSDYNEGVITTNYSVDVTDTFETDSTSLTINYAGSDTGDWVGKYGTIIDDLSLSLTLADLVVVENTEVVETSQVGSLDAVSIVDTLSSGIIDISSTIQDIPLDINMADISISNELPIEIEMPELEMDMPEIEMPDLTDMPEIEMPDDLPEINDIEIETVNEPEPETLEEIREEIPDELEETDMEEDIKETEENIEEDIEEKIEDIDEIQEDLKDETAKKPSKAIKKKVKEKKEKTKELKDKPQAKKTVKPAKTKEKEKKEGSDSSNIESKKTISGKTTSKIKSDIVIKEIDLPTVISFNKEYFEQKITDTLDLTTTEIDFYEQDGFNNNQDYAQANSDFFNLGSNSNSEWDLVSKRHDITIKQFRR